MHGVLTNDSTDSTIYIAGLSNITGLLYSEYKDDIRKGVTKKRANINLGVNIAFEAGEAATGTAGAVAGAKLGAVIGSFVPGAGTVVGAVAGTVIGAGISFVAGKSFENIIEDKYK